MSINSTQNLKSKHIDLITGSLWSNIFKMSLPLLISTISSSIIGLADIQVSKNLGTNAQAAVGISEQILFLCAVLVISMGVGTTALISKAWGAKKINKAKMIFTSSLIFNFILSLLLIILQFTIAPIILKFMNLDTKILHICQSYLYVFSWNYIPLSLLITLNAGFRAIGDAKRQMITIMVQTLLNITLDVLLVKSPIILKALGTTGIAYAAIASSSFGTILAFLFFANSALFDLKFLGPRSIKKIFASQVFRIGFPSAIQRLNWVISGFVIFYIFSTVCKSSSAIAAWSIGLRLESLLFMPLVALSLAVAPIVGQSIGAKNYHRAFDATTKVIKLGVSLMLIASLIMYLGASHLAKFSSLDPKTIKIIIEYLRYNALAEPVLAITMIINGALQGDGNTKFAMFTSSLAIWFVRLPLAYLLALKFGPSGVFMAMVSSTLFSSIIMSFYFYKLNWQNKIA